MAINDPGAGGSPASNVATSTAYALDRPYSVGWPLTATGVSKLNEMFELLFKAQTKATAAIAAVPTGSGNVVGPASAADGDLALFNGVTGQLIKSGGQPVVDSGLRVVSINLSNAQIAALSTTPVYVLVGQGAGSVIVPLLVEIEVIQSVAYTSAPNWQMQYFGIPGVSVINPVTSDLNNARNKHTLNPINQANGFGVTNSAVTNKGLQITFSADPTGAGTATAVVSMTYYVRGGSGL